MFAGASKHQDEQMPIEWMDLVLESSPPFGALTQTKRTFIEDIQRDRLPEARRKQAMMALLQIKRKGASNMAKLNGLELTIQKAKKLQIKQSELKPFEDMLVKRPYFELFAIQGVYVLHVHVQSHAR